MLNKKLTILFAVFIVLAGVFALQTYTPQLFPRESYYFKQVKGLKKEAVGEIILSKNVAVLDLKKVGNIWTLNGKKASNDKINELLTALLSPDEELVGETAARHRELQLTEDTATDIKLDKLELLAGKTDTEGTFIRFAGNNQVFLLKSLKPESVTTDRQAWYDLTVVRIEEKDLKKLTFQTSGQSFNLEQQNGNWKINGNNANQEKTNPIMLSLGSFQATSLAGIDQLSNYPMNPDLTLTIDYSGGKEILQFFKGEKDYLVKRSPDTENFILSEFQVKDFLLSAKEIQAPAKPQ